MNLRTCCFFGHKQILRGVDKKLLSEKIEQLILSGFSNFLFGGYGEFDSLCYYLVKELKSKYPTIKLIYVQPYLKSKDMYFECIKEMYDETYYPEIEDKPLRFAIQYRNQSMIDDSDFCIFYVYKSYGGAFLAMQYAKRKKKDFFNVC